MTSFVGRLNKLFVALYKALGLTALALIFLGLASYLGTQGFFLLSSRWVAPTIVSPLDDHVLRLNTEIAEKEAARDKLAVDRAQLWTQREDAVRNADEARAFRQLFLQAVGAERADRARALAELAALKPGIEVARRELVESGRAFSGMARTRSEAMRQVQLIDREALLTTNHQLAEQALTELSMAQREMDVRQRLKDLEREQRALDAAASLEWRTGGAPFTTRVLLETRQPVRARIEEQHAEDLRTALDGALGRIDDSIGRYDRLLATLRASPWLAAVDGSVSVAFAPYDNLKHVRPGTPLYACSAGLFLCRRVGQVDKIFQGEVTHKHPVRQAQLRGAMVQLELSDARYGRESILHVGRPPFLF